MLRTRIAALEAAIDDDDQGRRFEFAPVMAVKKWCEAAAQQQAELCREISDG